MKSEQSEVETRVAVGRTSLLRMQKAKPANLETMEVAQRISLLEINRESVSC